MDTAAACWGFAVRPSPSPSPHQPTNQPTKPIPPPQKRDPVACYEVIAEVATDSLVEPENRVGKFAGEVALLLEAQEDGFVARVLQPAGGAPGAVVKVGAPVAVLCEEEEEVGG